MGSDFYLPLDSTKIRPDSPFVFERSVNSPGFYTLKKANGYSFTRQLYLKPGDTLLIRRIDHDLAYNGNASYLNSFYQTANQVAQKADTLGKSEKYALPVDSFKQYTRFVFKQQKQAFRDYFKGRDVPSVYHYFHKLRRQYRKAREYFRYLRYHHYYADDVFQYYLPEHSYYGFLDSINWSDSLNGVLNRSFGNLISAYVHDLHEQQTPIDDTVDAYWHKYRIIKDSFEGINRDIALAELSENMNRWLRLKDELSKVYEQAGKMMRFIKVHQRSKAHFLHFRDNYRSFVRIRPGKPAPDFTLSDTAGREIALSDFKGKVVYIDFWGTWCPPCREAIPSHVKLRQQFEDTDKVVFLNVAMEAGEEEVQRWQKFLRNHQYPGTHVVARNQFANKEIAPYNISAAPTYVLIGKNGKIADPRAGSPSSVESAIEALLKK